MKRPALFMDRDGVINEDDGYVHNCAGFRWIPGVFDTVRVAAELGLNTIVVTNQAGIGRGYYSTAQFLELTDWMKAQFADHGAPLLAVYFCPFHAEARGDFRVHDHPDRKPNPGMLLRAAAENSIDLGKSAMIGDKPSDIEAAKRAGLSNYALFGNPEVPHAFDGVSMVSDHSQAQDWLRELYRPVVT